MDRRVCRSNRRTLVWRRVRPCERLAVMETLKLGLRLLGALIAVLALPLLQAELDASDGATNNVCTARHCA